MNNKTIFKTVRFSPEEIQKIKHRSEELNISVSQYIRNISLNGEVLKLSVPEYQKILNELNRIGNILNQIARQLHETNSLYYDDIQNIKEEYENLCLTLSRLPSTLRLKNV